jgi:zinc transport system substrate-binding protein
MGVGRWRLLVATVCLLAVPLGAAADKLVVYTVNYPLQYFAQRIAGEHAEVIFPGPIDADPAFWQPDAATIGAFQRADLILLNGAGYAKWVKRVSLPRGKLVDTAAGFRSDLIETGGAVTHSHGREGSHSHAGTAFTTWLDFNQAADQVRAIGDALSRVRPQHANTFAANARALEQALLDLDSRLKAIVATAPEKPLIASHPVYQYLARRYGLNLKAVMWEPETVPDEDQWMQLERLLREHPAGWMLWEGEPAFASVERLQQLGVQSMVFDPCATQPEAGDFLGVMSNNVMNLEPIFQ